MAPMDDEQLEFQQQVEKIKSWWSSPRFESVKRPYSAESIVSKQGTFMTTYRSNMQAQKLWTLLKQNKVNRTTSYTFGALDPIQTVDQQLIYLSGSSIDKVDYLFRTQLFYDRKQREERVAMTPDQREKIPNVDYLKPIIVDVGHGGIATIMKLTKMCVERGAAGIHVEDQPASSKKYENRTGNIIIPTAEHINRLVAVRAQCDIMGVENLVTAHTRAISATCITSNVDSRDHPFILGTTNPTLKPLSTVLLEAESQGIQGSALQRIHDEWIENADLKCYSMAVVEELIRNDSADLVDDFLNDTRLKSHKESRFIAQEKYRVNVFWDWDIPRDRDGFFRYGGSTEAAIARSIDYTDYADMLWMETEKSALQQAQKFARYILAASPQSLLCYHISPSFNWDTTGLADRDIRSYMDQLTKLGYVWQFITLDGIHPHALATDLFTRYDKKKDIYHHAPYDHHKNQHHNVDILPHQKWLSANYIDKAMKLVAGDTTTAIDKDGTEEQFNG
ncbi:isocitrate lyase [Backusella circina FSU 941]|nr:isocitrate lyase [Backusella circina FSU 941]